MRTVHVRSLAWLALFTLAACCHHKHADNPAEPSPQVAAGGEVAAPGPAVAAAPLASGVQTKDVTYSAGATQLNGFIAYPAGNEKRPGVLIVHEWWGLNDYSRARAQKLAEEGYVGFALDMYGGGKVAAHPDDAKKFAGEVMSNMPEAKARFEAARALLASDPRVDSTKLVAIGYCFGGGVVLQMARAGEPLAAVASFHGMLAAGEAMKPGAFPGRIFVATGGADPFVPADQVDAFKKEMDAAGAHYEVVVYPGAQHAFTNPAATETGKKFQMPLAYDASADAASWQKLEELLKSL
jgi:dienelactone hydrolase